MSSLISEIQRSLQHAVSGDKYRYREGGWDLDLTYITPRIIAMGIPGDGMSANWRNSQKDVAAFLRTKHVGHFKVFNLSGETYNYALFDHHVIEYTFPDHHPPPLDLYFKLLQEMHAWLMTDKSNVVAVHCLAGRSRTGTVIAGYFLYSSFCENAFKAISYFNAKRSLEAKDVCLPSQIRYVGYMDQLLQDHDRRALTHPATRILRAVVITPPFRLEGSVKQQRAIWKPHLRIQRQALPQETLYRKTYSVVHMTENSARLEVPDIPMTGDVLLKLSHVASNPITYGRVCMKIQKVAEAATSLDAELIVDIARISFHTSFIEGDFADFPAFTVDAHKAGPIAAGSKYIPENFSITLEFEPLSNTQKSTPMIAPQNSPSSSSSGFSSPSPSSIQSRDNKKSNIGPMNNRVLPPLPEDRVVPSALNPRIYAPHNPSPAKASPLPPWSPSPSSTTSASTSTPTSTSSPSSGFVRSRTNSDPPPVKAAVNGRTVYSHDALIPPGFSLIPNVTASTPASPTIKLNVAETSSPSSTGVVEGSSVGFYGVQVAERDLDAISEFKREQEARKRAAMLAYSASGPVQNIYAQTPATASPSYFQPPQTLAPVYAPVHTPAITVSSSPAMPPQSPAYYTPSSSHQEPYVPKRRPVSVHYGAIPNLSGAYAVADTPSPPGYVHTPPAYKGPSVPTSQPSASNPYLNPQIYAYKPAPAPATASTVPAGWPPGYGPPNANLKPSTAPNSYSTPYQQPQVPNGPVPTQWRW